MKPIGLNVKRNLFEMNKIITFNGGGIILNLYADLHDFKK